MREQEVGKEAIVDDECEGMSGWCMKWRKNYLKRLIEIVISCSRIRSFLL